MIANATPIPQAPHVPSGDRRWFAADELSNDVYHGDLSRDSSTSLKEFRKSPQLYYQKRIACTLPPDEPTDAMKLGTATHAVLLEPERFGDVIEIIPREVLSASGSKSGKKYEEWEAAQGGRICLKPAEADKIKRMADSVWGNPAAREVLAAHPERERSLYWTCPATGIDLKCRYDSIQSGDNPTSFVDLKTAAKPYPDDMPYTVKDSQWHVQAALYRYALGVSDCVHVVVGNAEPFDCFVYRLPKISLDVGLSRVLAVLRNIADCRDDLRPWQSQGWGDVIDLDLPEYSYR